MKNEMVAIPKKTWKYYNTFRMYSANGVACIHPTPNTEWIDNKTCDGNYWFNPYQYFLYRRCLNGLNIYTPDELRHMSSQKKNRIKSVHARSIEVLNLLKQRVMIKITNKIILNFTGEERSQDGFVKDFLSHVEVDPEYSCVFTFEQLKIDRKMIALELVDKKCLPSNFSELTINDDPRMIKLRAPQEPLDKY
jgi:hypothetical protein